MRELKFRIWDKQNKTWLENSSSLHCFSNWSICPFTGKLIDYVGAIDGDHGDKYTASPAPDYYVSDKKIVKEPRYVVQQYTGLKDKNGKEIYEGDIISGKYCYSSDAKIVVKYYDGAFNISSEYWQKDSLIVLGNIFENPELIQ